MTDDAHGNRITRHYLLMVMALLMAIIFLVGSGKPPSGSFQAAMWCWIAISAYRGDTFTAKWIVATLIILQVVGFIVRINISDSSISILFPEIERRYLVVSSGITVLVFAGIYFYADYLHNRNISHIRHPSKYPSHTHDESALGLQPNKNEANEEDVFHDEDWNSVAEFFPNIVPLHEALYKVDKEFGRTYRDTLTATKNFAAAEELYWKTLNDIATTVCGNNNRASREFLLSAINNGEYSTARRFISLSKLLGPDNMNDSALSKFKTSAPQRPEDGEQWREIIKKVPKIESLYRILLSATPEKAESYRQVILSQKSLYKAEQVFEETVQDVLDDHCRGKNWQPRSFLLEQIESGRHETALRFMKLARAVGPENVDNVTLDRFKNQL